MRAFVDGAGSGTSIGALFLAGIVPGLLMGLVLAIQTFIVARRKGFPVEEPFTLPQARLTSVRAVPPLMLPVILLGGIYSGAVTPTEAAAVAAVCGVDEVAGRYSTVQLGRHSVRMLLAKNPAGWQEALSMVDTDAGSVVIAVNGQVPDGEDLSWLWDVNFEHFVNHPVVAAGERGTDLAVRLGYAGVEHTLVHNTVEAITSCPPGHVEVVANYTAFLQLNRTFGRAGRG